MAGLAEMYQDYIDGKRELKDINMSFQARYVKKVVEAIAKECEVE
jgi:hypothetical protein